MKRKHESEDESYSSEEDPSSSDISSEEGCEDDNCIDSDCDVKDSYKRTGARRPLGQTIRSRFYGGFNAATQHWAAIRHAALSLHCPANQFQCEHCNHCVPDSQMSIDHVVPVATHWNNTGRNTTQNARSTWYNDTTNLEIVAGNHNSSMGSGGVLYRRDVGPNFVGGPNC